MAGSEKALGLLKKLPRVGLNNLRPFEHRKKKRSNRGQHGGRFCGRGKGSSARGALPPVGYEGRSTPFYIKIPMEPYYKRHHVNRQYPPLTLLQLQHLIDLGWIDPDEPIDISTFSNCPVRKLNLHRRHFGFNLTDEGADIFDAKVNIEIQWASELTIAAIEKNGGTITTKYYDFDCVKAMANPLEFFKSGYPIPKNKLPPQDAIEFYSNPQNRGYLADPKKIGDYRFELAQKYGYILPDITKDPKYEMLTMRKDPLQIWYGLEPGWVVNVQDKTILKPKSETLKEYYKALQNN